MTEFTEIVRQIATENAEVADYRTLSEAMLDEIRGRERELLSKLLPGYMRAVLSRRNLLPGSDEQAWEDFLAERIPTADRGTVFVRDATTEDVSLAVERRRKFAGALDKRAEQFERVHEKLKAAGVARVRDLPTASGVETLRECETRLALVHAARLRAAGRARTIESLRKTRDQVQHWLAADESPVITLLRERRDTLIELIRDEEFSERRTAVSDEVFRERFPGLWFDG